MNAKVKSSFRRYAEQIAPGGDLEQLLPEQSPFESFQAGETATAMRAIEKLLHEEEPNLVEKSAFEAIIRPRTRPIVDIISGSYVKPATPWEHYDDEAIRACFHAAIPAVGRIGVQPAEGLPFAGTGFLVAKDLLMTNRHVAQLFANGLGMQNLQFTRDADVNFLQEHENPGAEFFDVVAIVMIHPWWDTALLRVAGLEGIKPLSLSVKTPEELADHDIAVIGYPARDPRNDAATQDRIFGGRYNIKRLQPGKLWERRNVRSFSNDVNAITHDCSTLGGNSGSAVILAVDGTVAALHFAGLFSDANFAVPTWELARDVRVVETGLNFAGSVSATDAWDAAWRSAEGPRKATIYKSAELTPRGEAEYGNSDDDVTENEGTAAIAPDPNWAGRPGYKADFLGFNHTIPLPYLNEAQLADVVRITNIEDEPHLLKYHHFTICQSKSRCLPYYTAVNINGMKEVNIPRPTDHWFLDPRISREYQYTADAYTGTPLDRGHLVRRIDPVWGNNYDEAKLAHDDTFHWTNSSPQHAKFNRNKHTWALVENHIMKHTNKDDVRASVFTGPVFRDEDPIVVTPQNVKIQIPLQFWKIVVTVDNQDRLTATGFLISQEEIINAWVESLEFPVSDDVKPFQVSLAEIEQLTDLAFGDLTQLDPLGAGREAVVAPRRRIASLDDIVLC